MAVEPPKDFEDYLIDYENRFYSRVECELSSQKFAHNSVSFLLCVLQRSKDLYLGFKDCIENNHINLAYLGIRAHMETAGSIAYFLRKLRQYYNKQLNFEEIDSILSQLHLGRKWYEDDFDSSKEVAPVGVLKLIDAVDTVAKDSGKKFKDSYDWYSEFCHPNAFGKILGVNFLYC